MSSESLPGLLRRAADAISSGNGPDWSAQMTNETADSLAAWLLSAAHAADAYPAAAEPDSHLARMMRMNDLSPAYRATVEFIQGGVAFARAVLGDTEEREAKGQ